MLWIEPAGGVPMTREHICLPSKNLIRTAKVVDLVSRAGAYGIHARHMQVDMAGVRSASATWSTA